MLCRRSFVVTLCPLCDTVYYTIVDTIIKLINYQRGSCDNNYFVYNKSITNVITARTRWPPPSTL